MDDFFHMGGYGFYVWLSYGLTAVIMLVNVVMPKIQEKQIKRELIMRIDRQQSTSGK